MKFSDLISLAKQGYTPADIKELLALAEDNPKGEKPAETSQKDEQQPEPEKPAEETAQQEDPKPAVEDNSAELQKQIDELKVQLAAAQKANAQRDLSGEIPDPNQYINDLVREFM